MSDDFQPRPFEPRPSEPRPSEPSPSEPSPSEPSQDRQQDRASDDAVEADAPRSEGAPPPAASGRGPAPDIAPEGPGPVPVSPPAPPPPSAPPRDPNLEAIARAGLPGDVDAWLREVAGQVDPRLDRVAAGWRRSDQSAAARACVFGLMLGRLANDYPYTSNELSQVAEAHPSFGTLPAGGRLATLREIALDKGRGAAWIAPLVGVDDPSRLYDILD